MLIDKREYAKIFHGQGEGAGGSAGVKVDTEQLASYGSYLINSKESLDSLMDALDKAMAGITSGWGDQDGEELTTKFSSFITDAKKISKDIYSLGIFVTLEAAKYNTILTESLSMMGGG